MDRAGRAHVLEFVVVLGVALLLHYGLLPVLGRRVGIRETPAYFLAVALLPVALWLIPAFSRVLAGLLTSLLPGAWLLDALDLRLVHPARGEVIRPAEWFERTLGPVGAVAILVGFVTLLHTSGFSYESALFLLGLWAVRLFPAVFGAVCVYRLAIEPQVLPGLDAWCVRTGIETRKALPSVLTEWAASKARTPRSPS